MLIIDSNPNINECKVYRMYIHNNWTHGKFQIINGDSLECANKIAKYIKIFDEQVYIVKNIDSKIYAEIFYENEISYNIINKSNSMLIDLMDVNFVDYNEAIYAYGEGDTICCIYDEVKYIYGDAETECISIPSEQRNHGKWYIVKNENYEGESYE